MFSSLKQSVDELPWGVKIAAGTVITGVTTVIVAKKLSQGPRYNSVEYPKDTVVLHQRNRGPFVPCLIPFAVKVETYLRMARIPYMNVHDFTMSPKGKIPWIELNGEKIADSSFIIKYLNKKFGVDLNAGFTKEEKAIAHSWRKMIEENTYWTLVLDRWAFDKDRKMADQLGLSWYNGYVSSQAMTKRAIGQGMGVHTQDEVYAILREDLTALSTFLGSKKFLLGDNPCEEDCGIFGLLAICFYQSKGYPTQAIFDEYPTLMAYCNRMKDTFWPDWDECNTNGGRKKATK